MINVFPFPFPLYHRAVILLVIKKVGSEAPQAAPYIPVMKIAIDCSFNVNTVLLYNLLLVGHYCAVYGVGNPWVINLDPYTYPPKPTPLTKGKGLLNPIPLPMGMGFDGYG